MQHVIDFWISLNLGPHAAVAQAAALAIAAMVAGLTRKA